jgi:hypothetical protein
MWHRWGSDLSALIVLALVTMAFFWKVLFTTEYTILAGWDGSVQWYAWYRFAADWVRRGVLPLWDPYVYGGHSFIGEAQAGLFYPFNLLQAFLIPAGQSLSPSLIYWMAAFHGFLAASFMYLLARVLGMQRGPAIVSGVIFSCGGFLGHRLFGHLSIYYGCVWLPLLLALLHLAVTRRRPLLAVLAGLVLGMVALVGHLMPPVYSGLVLAAYAVYLACSAWRRRQRPAACLYPLVMLLLVGAFALGAAAVQIIPSLEYESLALKWTGAPAPPLRGNERSSYEIASSFYYLHPQQLVSFLIPFLYSPEEGSGYFGILPLVLMTIGVLAWRRRGVGFFTLLGLAALLFALGRESVVHALAWLLVPLLEKARIAVRGLYIVTLCAALLAGWGVQAMLLPTPRLDRLVSIVLRLFGYAAAAVALGAIALATWGIQQSPPAKLDFYFSFVLMTLMAWAALATWRPLRLAPRAWYALLLAVLLFDLLSHGSGLFRVVSKFDRQTNWSPEIYYRDIGAVRFLKDQPGYFRVDVRNNVLSPNLGDVWSLYSVTGHGNTMVEDYHRLRSLAWQPGGRLYDMLNVRYVVATDTVGTLPLVYDGDLSAGDLKVYENPTALPRAWVVHKTIEVPPGQATWERIASPGFDPLNEAIVASPVDLPPGGSGGSARITEYTLHAIAVEVDSPVDALLVMSENYYPGWTARVDGQLVEVVRVNGGLRGVLAPSGQHGIVFTYEPMSFKLGAIVTAVTLLIAGLIGLAHVVQWIVGRRRARQTSGQSPRNGIARHDQSLEGEV